MTNSRSVVRLAFLLSNFRQGQGGVPEAVRLMAQAMMEYDCVSDVVVGGRVFENVGTFPHLPKSHNEADRREIDYRVYDYIIMVGAWQSPFGAARALFRSRSLQRLIYVPKGGIAKIEFSRSRDLKKVPYLYSIEVFWLFMACRIVFSSKLEMNSSYFPISLLRSKCKVIPDLFLPSWPPVNRQSRRAAGEKVRFSFLAEIHPRKGLEEVVYGFHDWVVQNNLFSEVVLKVGGGPRPGSEKYYDGVLEFVKSTPLRECVEFAGPVAHEDRCSFYADSHVFLATSRFESFCLTVLEALHSGCFVLAGPNLGVLEYVNHHPNLFQLADLSRETIAEGLQQIANKIKKNEEGADQSGDGGECFDVSQLVNSIAVDRWRDVLGLLKTTAFKGD